MMFEIPGVHKSANRCWFCHFNHELFSEDNGRLWIQSAIEEQRWSYIQDSKYF